MGGGISDLIRYTNGFKLLFYFYVILFIVFDICSTYFICNMLDVNRILKLYFILSENKKTKLKKKKLKKYHIAQTPPKVEINIKNTTKILYTGRIAAAPDGKNCGTQLI